MKYLIIAAALVGLSACDVGTNVTTTMTDAQLERKVKGDDELEKQFAEAKKDGITADERSAIVQAIVGDAIEDQIENTLKAQF